MRTVAWVGVNVVHWTLWSFNKYGEVLSSTYKDCIPSTNCQDDLIVHSSVCVDWCSIFLVQRWCFPVWRSHKNELISLLIWRVPLVPKKSIFALQFLFSLENQSILLFDLGCLCWVLGGASLAKDHTWGCLNNLWSLIVHVCVDSSSNKTVSHITVIPIE
jgi:hypothetical protein